MEFNFSENLIIENEELKSHTSFKIGGPAKRVIIPKTKQALVEDVDILRKSGERFMILGNGSNVLFADEGYDGSVIILKNALEEVNVQEDRVIAEAGASLKKIARVAMRNSLSGMEFMHGIPGSLGGAVVMNAGAYGGELKDIIESVEVLDPKGVIREISNEDMKFSYRHSIVQDENLIVLSAKFALNKGDRDEIEELIKKYDSARSQKQPLNYPSAGSTFKRPVGGYASKLIEDANLKSVRVGGAMVSPKHSGFIINYEDASCEDVLNLIAVVQKTVYDKFKIKLEPEVRIIPWRS